VFRKLRRPYYEGVFRRPNTSEDLHAESTLRYDICLSSLRRIRHPLETGVTRPDRRRTDPVCRISGDAEEEPWADD
jgi:hypothetical protein